MPQALGPMIAVNEPAGIVDVQVVRRRSAVVAEGQAARRRGRGPWGSPSGGTGQTCSAAGQQPEQVDAAHQAGHQPDRHGGPRAAGRWVSRSEPTSSTAPIRAPVPIGTPGGTGQARGQLRCGEGHEGDRTGRRGRHRGESRRRRPSPGPGAFGADAQRAGRRRRPSPSGTGAGRSASSTGSSTSTAAEHRQRVPPRAGGQRAGEPEVRLGREVESPLASSTVLTAVEHGADADADQDQPVAAGHPAAEREQVHDAARRAGRRRPRQPRWRPDRRRTGRSGRRHRSRRRW